MLRRVPRLAKRSFANEVTVQHATPVDGAMPTTPHEVESTRHKTYQYRNQMLADANAQSAADNKQYTDMLADVDARQKFFSALTAPNAGDHSEVSSVKSRIAALIQ